MKYAITHLGDSQKQIFVVQDTPNSEDTIFESHEISDEEATIISSSDENQRWHIHEGTVKNSQEMKDIYEIEIISNKLSDNYENDIEGGKKFLRDRFSIRRYYQEVGGITVLDLDVRTDRLTVDRIYQSRILAKEDAAFTTDWKLGDGSFVTLDATTIITIADAVTQHLKDSFSKEKTINEQIDTASTIEDLKSIQW